MIETKLTRALGIDIPIIGAPMALAAGGALAAAVSDAGGLGLIGGGYCDRDWIFKQMEIAGDSRMGCGMISWALKAKLDLLDEIIARKPSAIFLSFGNPAELAKPILQAGIPLICQIQTLADARHALDCGANVIVAQGAEAGGHGEDRATFTLVPEVADLIAQDYSEVSLCAAGGIADGRGLAAALMLGADGAVVGSRLWATQEALVHPNMHACAMQSSGDQTIRSSVMDIARHLKWPRRYTARVLQNRFTDRWHEDIDGLLSVADSEASKWKQAWQEGNMDVANTFVGEAAGLIHDIPAAAACVQTISQEARQLLGQTWSTAT
ncbi:MAG: nitronate monooxygenase [Pseudomonadota bacterium]